MREPQQGDEGELLDIEAASALLEVPVAQVQAMVEQGLLVPAEASSASEPRFPRGEVIAARELGG